MTIIFWLTIWVVLSVPVGLVAGSALAAAATGFEVQDEPGRAMQGW